MQPNFNLYTMKKCLLIVMLFVASNSLAQIRHVNGVKSLEGGYGYSPLTRHYYLGFVKYTANKWQWKINAFYLNGEDQTIEFNSMGIDFAPAYTLFSLGETFYFNARSGATISIDKLSNDIGVYDSNGNLSNENYNTFKFGVFGGFETETFINDKFVFILGVNQRYLIGDKFGNNRWFGNVGLRFNL